MLCPNCSSEDIVWDYERGYIVCTHCGLVLDSILEPPTSLKVVEAKPRSVREAIKESVTRNRARKISIISQQVSLYERYAKRARKNVYVDINNLYQRILGKPTRIYIHKAEGSLKNLIEENSELRSIIEKIVNRDPVLASRTFRGKVALALLILDIIKGRDPDLDKIAKLTSLSRTHIKRLYNLVMNRLNLTAIRI